MSTIGVYDLADAVWSDIKAINPGPAFEDATWDMAENLAEVLDGIQSATSHRPVESISSTYYQGVYSGTMTLSIYGSGIDKLFGENDAIGTVNITRVNFSWPASEFELDLRAAGSGILIDFNAGLHDGVDLFDGTFQSFSFTTHDLSFTAAGSIAFQVDPDSGETGINGTLSSLAITYLTAPGAYSLSIGGDIHFNQSSSGDISLDGSRFSSFSISESGNLFTYTGDFTYTGNLESGYMAGSIHDISVRLAGATFVIKGDIRTDGHEHLSGTITDLDIHAAGTGYDARYQFAGKSVNVLDLFNEDGDMKDIDGTGEVNEHDLYQFLVNHVDGATLTGLNMSPNAVDDFGSTGNTTTLTVDAAHGVLANDTDPDGDALVITEVNGSSTNVGTVLTLGYYWLPVPPYYAPLGTITINADGSYVYVPGSASAYLTSGQTVELGADYVVSDGHGNTSEATLRITVTGENHAPVLTVDNATVTISENATAGEIAGADADAADADGDTISFSLVGAPVDGDGDALFSIDSVTGQISLTVAGAAALDAVTTPEYELIVKASDGNSSDDQTEMVTINVDSGKDCTVAVTYWKSGDVMEGVQTTITNNDNGQQRVGQTEIDGTYSYTGLAEGDYALDATKESGVSEAMSVNLLDTLLVFRMALGHYELESSYQLIAGNVDKTGDIDLYDVLGSFRMALGHGSMPEWVFVPEGSTTIPESDMIVPLDQTNQNINLVGVLLGDVDGSWVA